MLRYLLERAGHEVHEAADGPSGVEALTVRPEVALVDVGLPGLDGYEVARRAAPRRGRHGCGWWPSPATACPRTTGARGRRASTPTS